MRFRKLGNTDLDISIISLGAMTFGEQNSSSESFELMNFAVEKGINYFDTAEMYPIYPKKETCGKSEEIIGDWLKMKKNRDKIIIGTKVASNHPAGIGATKLAWIRGGGDALRFDKENINKAIDGSLKRLKTDYIDVYQLHWPERKVGMFGQLDFEYDPKDYWTPMEEVLENLESLIKSGKVRYVGLSNETPWGILNFLRISDQKKLPRMMSVQNPYSLLNRTYEVGLAEVSVREESGLLAYSPLAFGYLTGKYRNGELPKNSRMKLFGDQFHRYKTQNGQLAIEEYYKIANKYDLDFAQMSIKFLEIQPFVTSVIIGATTMEQLKINIESVNVNLSDEVIKEINEIQKIYPNPCP